MISTSEDVIDYLTRSGTLADFREVGDAVQKLADPRLKNICMIHGTEVNPFFVPHAQPGMQALNSTQWLYVVSQARAAAAQGNTRRMMVAAPMKSGSTFISKSLATAFQLPRVSLIMLLARAYDYAMLGAATRAHEIDELALLSNIFDMLVSLDDFTRKHLLEDPHRETFFRYGVPANYASLDFDQRISRLLDRNLNFYVSYYTSWTLAEHHGLIKPFWISYEDEISGGARGLSGRIAEAFARNDDEAGRVAATLGEGGRMEHIHFNKGVAGRGRAITGRNRERVLEAFADFSEVADWSELLA
jgi:hypothetical protein